MVKINMMENYKYTFEELVEIICILRSPGGCPWDMEQTHKSIRNEFIEETYEAADAIDRGSDVDLCEELGDVLLQILLHSQMASETGAFDIGDVIDGIARKMILRHPHVFGDVLADTTEKVLENWDKIKRDEKHQKSFTDTLKSVPMSYPALMRAAKVQKRAAKAGIIFDEENKLFLTAKSQLEELENGDSSMLGDLLFTLSSISRSKKVDCEELLNKKTDDFISSFEEAENAGKIK